MSKKLNITSITNDLEGSSFFPSKSAPPPSPIQKPVVKKELRSNKKAIKEIFSVPPPVPSTEPPAVHLIPKLKRPIKQRQPFDIYEDKYETLKKIAESEKDFINGRKMSQMVREAIDTYLKNHDTTKK